MDEYIPRLRTDIEVIPTYYQGEKAFLVKDNLGLIEQPLLLRGEGLELLTLIDGKRNIHDIQYEIIRARRHTFVSAESIQNLLAELDEAYLLDSQRYRGKKQVIVEEFSRQAVRPASLAGKAYPEDRNELRTYLASIFHEIQDVVEAQQKKLAALVSPHIDLDVGKAIYAKAYHCLRQTAPERIVLLGTGHSLHDHFFSISEKDFETPLGRARTHKDRVRSLKEAGEGFVSPDDFVHRNEHSLEFQLLFLQYLFGADISVIPVLCGSFHKILGSCSRPVEVKGLGSFFDRLREIVSEVSNTLVVAGVDFSHIGPKFGDSWPASALLQEAKNHDTRLIETLCRADIESYWTEVQKVNNRYNVCGFSTLAVLLELIPGVEGELLGYDFWQEEATRSAVSFAAIAFAQSAEGDTQKKGGKNE